MSKWKVAFSWMVVEAEDQEEAIRKAGERDIDDMEFGHYNAGTNNPMAVEVDDGE